MPGIELSRRQIKYRLGCSIAQIQRWEAAGKLTGRRERETGYSLVWFPLEQVQKLQREWKPRSARAEAAQLSASATNARGKLAARAFRMFRDGRELVDVVIELEIDPILAEQFWKEYQLSFSKRAELARDRERRERDGIEQRRKDREDSLQKYRDHQKEIAEINRRATVDAARIAARRTA